MICPSSTETQRVVCGAWRGSLRPLEQHVESAGCEGTGGYGARSCHSPRDIGDPAQAAIHPVVGAKPPQCQWREVLDEKQTWESVYQTGLGMQECICHGFLDRSDGPQRTRSSGRQRRSPVRDLLPDDPGPVGQPNRADSEFGDRDTKHPGYPNRLPQSRFTFSGFPERDE